MKNKVIENDQLGYEEREFWQTTRACKLLAYKKVQDFF